MNSHHGNALVMTPELRLADMGAGGPSRCDARLMPAEARVSELNCLLRAIRGNNQLIVRERDPQRLLTDACNILVQTRGHALAWIGLTEP